jgi:hypothetical protein
MVTEQSLSGGNLGTVLETYGGKSLTWIVSVGAAIFGCGLTAAILIRVFRPDSLALATVVLGAGVVVTLAYLRTNWDAALGKVEVCEDGLRLVRRAGVGWNLRRDVACWSGVRIIELPWDRICKVRVGKFRKFRGPSPRHVVIRTTDGNDIEFPFHFWSTVGTDRFANTVKRFVEDVEVDVDFILGFESGVWRSISAEPDAADVTSNVKSRLRDDGR